MEEQGNPKMINNPIDEGKKQIYRKGNQNGQKLYKKMPNLASKEIQLRKNASDTIKCCPGYRGKIDMLLDE